jgi:hypothetical protein
MKQLNNNQKLLTTYNKLNLANPGDKKHYFVPLKAL